MLISTDPHLFSNQKNIFIIFHSTLKGMGFNICNGEILPFPSTRQQEKFKEKFKHLPTIWATSQELGTRRFEADTTGILNR